MSETDNHPCMWSLISDIYWKCKDIAPHESWPSTSLHMYNSRACV